MTEKYENWEDVPTGVIVHNGRWYLIKCGSFGSEPVVVGTIIRDGLTGWIHRTSGSVDGCGPFYRAGGTVAALDLTNPQEPRPPAAPRQWDHLEEVPLGVKVFSSPGNKWRRRNGQWQIKVQRGQWRNNNPIYSMGPFTEIVK
ncbi:hypothetical protein B5566_02655 [Mycobacterium sp. MHSD3]|nr:hypothetical protein B5566_02655 [Mycobacterium sp. MHSD3]